MPSNNLPGQLYTPADYLVMLQMSRRRRLLVEGKDDKELFHRLLMQFYPQAISQVDIDTAEQLREYNPPAGNRRKVELICEQAHNQPKADALVGFVDREFRDFSHDPDLTDPTPNHRTLGRLVWSRGHSVENYLFDIRSFEDRVWEYVPAPLAGAVDLFRRVFPDTIRVACALGLTGFYHSSPRLMRMAKSVGWQCLLIDNGNLLLDLDSWRTKLREQNESQDWSDEACRGFNQWWPRVQAADYEIVRWQCHGHIGLATIWAGFGRCVYESCPTLPPPERSKQTHAALTAVKEEARFRAVVELWVRHALLGRLDCPRLIFDMLGLHNPSTL